ncbi:hypothetical protein [Stenotrophomonas sp. GZD-301]|uniref:hypothetical protein n=1 Tax=Stenotrophomonas sp. GZD-301 TaxID=3404814 RepID=UPI003BB5E0AF
MQVRGYPTADQIDAARAFSADQLHREADRTGAPVDVSLYAQALLRERQHREAFGALVQSFSQDGNIYALYLLSDIYQNAHDMKNRPLAMTYLRLAYLAGDHKAGVTFAIRYGDAHPQELAAADMQAAHFRRQMAPGGSWPRP